MPRFLGAAKEVRDTFAQRIFFLQFFGAERSALLHDHAFFFDQHHLRDVPGLLIIVLQKVGYGLTSRRIADGKRDMEVLYERGHQVLSVIVECDRDWLKTLSA